MSTIQHLHQQAVQLINQRQFIQAHPLCVQLVKLNPEFADAYFLLGVINLEIGQVAKAAKLIEKAISKQQRIDYIAQLARIYALQGNYNQVAKWVGNLSETKLDSPQVLDTVGVALSHVGLHEKAVKFFKKAITLDNQNPSYQYNLGISAKFLGQVHEAKHSFERAIALKSDYFQAYFALSDLGGITEQENHLAQHRHLLKSGKLSLDGRLHIAHASAKELESMQKYDEAFTLLSTEKATKLKSLRYDFAQDQAIFDFAAKQISQLYENPSLTNLAEVGYSSEQPIFIVGMPRSGTTLVERILTSHSEVTSAGELQDFGIAVKELTKTVSNKVLDVETLKVADSIDMKALGRRYIERTQAVRGTTKHFVDKLPFNFFYISLIRQALPNAKIICLLRNSIATCVGNFRQLFSINSPYYFYSYDLANTAMFCAEFYELAKQLQNLQDPNVQVVEYESLVEHPESETRKLIEFCGLDWEAQCLAIEKNKTAVSTASNMQVRQPINRKFLDRWKNYEAHLDHVKGIFDQRKIPY